MPIIRAPRPDRDFTVIANRILNDPRLSWAARGMLVHLLSKPDHWTVNVQALVNETQASARASGRDAVYRTLEELDEVGYIVRKRLADGSVVTTVYEDPVPENPDEALNPNPENPDEVTGVGSAAVSEPVPENQDVGKKPHPEKPDLEKPDRDNPDVLVRTEFIERTEVVERTEGLFAITPTATKPKSRKRLEIALQEFLDNCKAAGEKPIHEGDPIFKYGDEADIPYEMIALAWAVFKDRFIESGDKKRDWRAQFRAYVKGGWLKLWYFDGAGECKLTTAGEQARRVHLSKKSRQPTDARYENPGPNGESLDELRQPPSQFAF
ncbi:hypothetical protein [Paraburkholderia caffeinilytica]|uniref:hypothetical protein n=1 Tax=Paraburkholderia caffeinilytica TaxID=1761016 RepID=UPI0038B87024